jgi:hypothetical protein
MPLLITLQDSTASTTAADSETAAEVVSDDTLMQYYHDSLISQQGHYLDPQLFLKVCMYNALIYNLHSYALHAFQGYEAVI